jgi:hypothetical protein
MESLNNNIEDHFVRPKWLAEQAAYIEKEYRDKANDLAERALALDLPEDMLEIILNHANELADKGARASDDRIAEHWNATHTHDEPEEGELD